MGDMKLVTICETDTNLKSNLQLFKSTFCSLSVEAILPSLCHQLHSSQHGIQQIRQSESFGDPLVRFSIFLELDFTCYKIFFKASLNLSNTGACLGASSLASASPSQVKSWCSSEMVIFCKGSFSLASQYVTTLGQCCQKLFKIFV